MSTMPENRFVGPLTVTKTLAAARDAAKPGAMAGLVASVLTFGSPNQARIPAGNRGGGRWMDTPGAVRGDLENAIAGYPTGSDSLSEKTTGTLSSGQAGDLTQQENSASPHLTENEDGTLAFTPERAALHETMIRERIDGVSPREGQQVFNMMGGGPAAGKSVFGRENPELFADTVVVNSDDYKMGEEGIGLIDHTTVPDGVTGSAWVHEESSYLAKTTMAEGFDRNVSMTFDGTGDNSAESTRKKMNAARDAGYSVSGFYVTCPTDEAVRRANVRAIETGRAVPEKIIRQTHDRVSQVFPRVVNDFDDAKLYDTHTKTLIGEKKKGGSFTIYDKPAWDRFVGKRNEFDNDTERDPIPDFPVAGGGSTGGIAASITAAAGTGKPLGTTAASSIAALIATGGTKEQSVWSGYDGFDEMWDGLVSEIAALPPGTDLDLPFDIDDDRDE